MAQKPDITSFDFEWFVYRKGSLHAHVQLDRNLLTWHDSAQWCNNFTQTLSDRQADELVALIHQSGLTDDGHEPGLATDDQALSAEGISWQITVQTGARSRRVQGSGPIPDRYLPLKEKIEQISHTCLIL